jgi:preprotein translocase subunit SecG
MPRALALLVPICALLLAAAPVAFGHDGGEGTYGPANDKVITSAGFILIAFFPLFILVMSLIQNALDKRKERRKRAHKALAREETVWRGGW